MIETSTVLVAALGFSSWMTQSSQPALSPLAACHAPLVPGHLRRMRPIYRARRDAVLDSLHRHLPELRPVGASAGLHVVAWLPDDVDETALVGRVASLGVAIVGITPCYSAGRAGPGGLLFGYGTPTEPEIEEGIRLSSRPPWRRSGLKVRMGVGLRLRTEAAAG